MSCFPVLFAVLFLGAKAMSGKLIGKAVFLRHGESNYTDAFPDLTETGRRTIRRSAEEIRAIKNRHCGSFAIVSSPAVRAKGSAGILADALPYTDGIREAPLLGPVLVIDRQQGRALYNSYISIGGMQSLCIAYGCDIRFEDGKILEPRSSVRERFYKYLGMLVRDFLTCGRMAFVAHISHYETLFHFVEAVFHLDYRREDPLQHGELILVDFCGEDGSSLVEMNVRFRRRAANIVFDHQLEAVVL